MRVSAETPLWLGRSSELPLFPPHPSELLLEDEAAAVLAVENAQWMAVELMNLSAKGPQKAKLLIPAHLCSFHLSRRRVQLPKRREHTQQLRKHALRFARSQD